MRRSVWEHITKPFVLSSTFCFFIYFLNPWTGLKKRNNSKRTKKHFNAHRRCVIRIHSHIHNRLISSYAAYAINNPEAERQGTMLNVSHCMCDPARMPVVPNRNEFFALQKTRSQKCTRMYIFDEVVAVGFNTLYYDAERCRGTAGIKPCMGYALVYRRN